MKQPIPDKANVVLLGQSYDSLDCKVKKQRKFTGTNNPWPLKVIFRLIKGSTPRDVLERVAGLTNGPDLTAELRRRDLDIPCQRIITYERDVKPTRHGVYSLSIEDSKQMHRWFTPLKKGGAK